MSITNEQAYFLHAIRKYLTHEETEPGMTAIPENMLGELWRLSAIHAVLPMVYEAIRGADCKDEAARGLMEQWKKQTKQIVYQQTVRTQAFLTLYRDMSLSGVKAVIVKGILCRMLYPQPDHRPSSDEDVLVPPEQFGTAHEILCRRGFICTDPVDPTARGEAQVVSYANPRNGLHIELHRRLFLEDSQAYGQLNRIFDRIAQQAVQIEVEGVKVWSPCPTDHMLFLIFHAFKHFLHAGFGIRQVCDISLYARTYADEIDWQQVYETLSAHRAAVFAASLWDIGRQYVGIGTSCPIPADAPPVEHMLCDLLDGGVYGGSSDDRRHSSLITLDAVAAPDKGHASHVRRTLFPSAGQLRGRYPYLKRHPWLLPVAWSQRLFSYALGKEHTSAAESIRIGRNRTDLLREYGIID